MTCRELSRRGIAELGLVSVRPDERLQRTARILGDASEKLRRYSVEGTELDRDKVTEYVGRSLMLVTALSPHIGYDKASAIAHKADDEGTTLREAALALGVSAADFDDIVNPKTMVGDPQRDLGLT